MSVFSRLGGLFKRSSKHPGDPALAEFFGGPTSLYNVTVTPETAMRVAAVYACVRVLAESIASTPLFLYRRVGDDKERAIDHPLYRVVHSRPNLYQSPFEFADQMQTWLGLRGAAYARIVVSARDGRQLIPLHPDRTRAMLNKDYEVVYEHWGERGREVLLQDEVLRVTYMVSEGVNPISPIRQQRDTIGAAIAEQKYTAAFFANGGRPPGWLQHPSHFKDDGMRKRWRQKFTEQFTGDNVGSTPLLEDGVTYNPVEISNEDAQLLELKKFSIAEIARIYRIPLILLSETEKSTSWGSGIEQFMLAFVTHTLRPWLVRWEQAYSRDLLTEEEQAEYFFEYNIDALLRSDLLTRYRAYEIGRKGRWLSANDVRVRENLNRIEDGDRYDDLAPTAASPDPNDIPPPGADAPPGVDNGN